MILTPCLRCTSPVPEGSLSCPHCGATCSPEGGGEIRLASLLTMGLALSACEPLMSQPEYGTAVTLEDADEDGWYEYDDCDDADPDIHPEAEEISDDGIDSNCDGDDNT